MVKALPAIPSHHLTFGGEMMDRCDGCDWNLLEVAWLFENKENTLEFLCGHNLMQL